MHNEMKRLYNADVHMESKKEIDKETSYSVDALSSTLSNPENILNVKYETK